MQPDICINDFVWNIFSDARKYKMPLENELRAQTTARIGINDAPFQNESIVHERFFIFSNFILLDTFFFSFSRSIRVIYHWDVIGFCNELMESSTIQ